MATPIWSAARRRCSIAMIVGIAESAGKGPSLSLDDERISLARRLALAGVLNVEVRGFASLALADLIRETGGGVILRGLRAVSDFE